ALVTDHFSQGGAPQITTAQIGLKVPVDTPSGDVAFKNGRIVTMAGDQVIERGTIVVHGNRIAAVGASEDVAIPAGAKVFDVEGKTVLPGFFDMHGHINNCYYTSSGLMPQKQQSRYAELAYG